MSHPHDKTNTSGCPSCDIGMFTRNHYFTGKLLVERDFTDEQRYHVEKLRHHNQRLHGWGVVCGLRVKQHENPACRGRYVCVEPGTAIDCCGREIIVRETECIDLTQFEAVKALGEQEGDETHTLQICVRYRECPTEEIPVLYDECGCDSAQCAPNRILESHEFSVIVDPPPAADSLHSPKLAWDDTIGTFAPALRVALHADSHRLYVLTGGNSNSIIQVNTDNHIPVAYPLPSGGLELAVSNDGQRLYVVAEAENDPATNPRRLLVLDTADLAQAPIHALDIGGSVASDIHLAVAPGPDGRLFAAVGETGQVWVWGLDLNAAAAPADPQEIPLGAGVSGLVIGSNAEYGVASSGVDNNLHVFDITSIPDHVAKTILPAGALASALAVVRSSGPDAFVVADGAANSLHLVAFGSPDVLLGSVALAHAPAALTVSPGGHWAYVLVRDGDQSFVQTVNLQRLRQNLPVIAGQPFEVGAGSEQVVISASGARLYVPYAGAAGPPSDGGVAVVTVAEQACDEIIWRHLDGCPDCDVPNCVVLATIENYDFGDLFQDQTDPPADVAADQTNDFVRIDNRQGRRLLPSTQVLAEMIECLMSHGPGGAGTQGPPGPQGPAGADGQDGQDGQNGQNGQPGEQGTAGPGLEEGLTRIRALSWRHNTQDNPLVFISDATGQQFGAGLVIGFSGKVEVQDVIDADHVFQVFVRTGTRDQQRQGLICRCPVVGRIVPVEYTDDGAGRIISAQATGSPSPGAAFIFDPDTVSGRNILNGEINELWVKLRCDFVLDSDGRAVDGEFVRAQLPTGDRPAGSAFGIQGGLFESWFLQRRQG
ncbi:MAG: hypothetical protein ABW208_24670 [Pyrinomonadaceae bacterium]